MKKNSFLLLLVLVCGILSYGQIPTDNPYRTRYKVKEHWTDSFKWSKVINVADVEGIVNAKREIDKDVFQSTVKKISSGGGGVLYFGPGVYYFSFEIALNNGVVLRGASPLGMPDAIDPAFKLSTKFEFPKFVMDFYGQPLSDEKAFKRIIIADDSASFAIVNIDINRGFIHIGEQCKSNIMLFGVRSNNATEHKAVFLPYSRGLGWQRYPTTEVGNFSLTCYKGVIANCKVNDSITDDFDMPNFLANDGRVFKDTSIRFQYGLQSGITVYNSEDKPGKLELLDNYVKAYYVSSIAADFKGEKIVKNNKFMFLPCQDLLGEEFYSREMQEHTKEVFKKMMYVNKEGDSLEYWLLAPKNYVPGKKYPLLMFFHGGGQKGPRNPLIHFAYIFANEETREKYPYFVVIPHIGIGQDFDTSLRCPPTKYYNMSIDIFKSLEEKYTIDTNMTFVAGISSGGLGAIEATVRNPELFHHAIIMSSLRRLNSEQMNRIKNVHFVFSYGMNDNSIEYAHAAVDALRSQGKKVDLFEYKDVGHWSWLNLCQDEKFLNMMFKDN